MFDIKQYESWDEDDYRKTYRHLRNVIERAIARAREDKHSAARDKYAWRWKADDSRSGSSYTESWTRCYCCAKRQRETKGQAEGEG